MRLVGGTKLDFGFIPAVGFGLLQEQVEPTGTRLDAFLILQDHVAEPQDRRILRDPSLPPALVQVWVVLQKHSFELDVSRDCHGVRP